MHASKLQELFASSDKEFAKLVRSSFVWEWLPEAYCLLIPCLLIPCLLVMFISASGYSHKVVEIYIVLLPSFENHEANGIKSFLPPSLSLSHPLTPSLYFQCGQTVAHLHSEGGRRQRIRQGRAKVARDNATKR